MSKIEWTNKTWNPVVGCTKISEGCKNCYAEKWSTRLAAMAIKNPLPMSLDKYVKVIFGRKFNGNTYFNEEELNIPLKRTKPTMYFVCSMGDLFHESISFHDILEVFFIISKCPQHTFQILTKRDDRMREFFTEWAPNPFILPLPNVWLGVTVEHQKYIYRIDNLLHIPAAVRFVSCEPLLEEIHIEKYLTPGADGLIEEMERYHDWIDWVIAGPETGHGKRPMQKEWIESLYNQCKYYGVAFFDKKNILGLDCKEFPKQRLTLH